jgi:hypothetical protein
MIKFDVDEIKPRGYHFVLKSLIGYRND